MRMTAGGRFVWPTREQALGPLDCSPLGADKESDTASETQAGSQ